VRKLLAGALLFINVPTVFHAMLGQGRSLHVLTFTRQVRRIVPPSIQQRNSTKVSPIHLHPMRDMPRLRNLRRIMVF
jgi:hypothetical protein